MKHKFIFGLPFSTANRNIMRRFGVGVLEEINANGQPALTVARRIAIMDATVSLDQVLAYDSANSMQSLNFQTVYQLNNSGTQDYYIGSVGLNDAWWARIEERLVNGAPVTAMRYARFLHVAERAYVLTADHNVPGILGPHVGQVMRPREALDLIGLKPYKPPGSI